MKSLSKRAISLILAVLMIMDVFTPVAVVASTNSPQNNVHVLDEVPESETNSQNNDTLIPATPQNNPQEDTLVPAEVPAQNSQQNSSQKPAQKPVQNKSTPNQLYKSWTLVNPGKTTYAKGDILDLSQLSVRVTKTDGTVTTLSYVQLLKDTNFDIIENVGNKINLQPGKGSVTLVGPSLNPITVNIVVNDSADKLQGTNSNDELVPAIDPQAKEENDELVVAENPNDKKTNIIEGNEQNSPEKELDKQKKEEEKQKEDDELKGNILDQVAGKETEENPLGLKAFDPLKALGLNREDRELTEEELEAGLTKVELPTLNEAPVSPVFARSTYQSTGLIGDANLKEDLGLDMSDEIAPEAVGAGNNEDPQNLLQLDGKKFNIRTNFQTKVANGPIRAGQYFKIKLDDKLTLKDKFSLQPLKYNGEVIATAKYNEADNTITYKLIADITADISVPVNIPVDYNTKNITPDENGNFVVTNKVSGLGVINPKDFNPKKVNKFGNVTNQITEPGRKEVTEIIESNDKEHKVYLEEWATPVIEDKNLVGFNWTFTVTSDTDLNSLGYRANFTTVKGSGLGEIKDVKINGQDVELTDQLQNGLGIVDSKHHALESEAQGITYTFYTEVTDKQSAYMVDFSLALTAQNKVGAKRCIADEGYNLDDIAVATTSRVGMNNRTTILGEFPIIDGAKWTVTDAVSTGDNNEILPLEQRTLGGDQSQTGAQIAVYKLNSDGQMVEDKAAEEAIRATEAQETFQVADQPVGTIAAYVYDTAINKDENQPEAKKELTLGGVEIAINAEPLADDSWQMEGSLDVSEEEAPQAVGAGKALTEDEKKNFENKKYHIITRFDTSNAGGAIQPYQYFDIHLDNKLKVNNPSELQPLYYQGRVIARPQYIESENKIRYNIQGTIPENIRLPLDIPVDYNIPNIKLDTDGTFTVINKVSGLGIVNPPKDLLPQKVDKYGNPAGTIIEPGRHDVTQIIEPDGNYRVYIGGRGGTPRYKDGKLEGFDWHVTVESTYQDLKTLNFTANFTTVKGSGLGEIKDLKIDGNQPAASEVTNNPIEGQFGIVSSKNYKAQTPGVKKFTYTFFTPATNTQEEYVLDLSAIANGKLGASRLIAYDNYSKEKIAQATPTRVGINNRTTIMGKFENEKQALWTVTDAVSTGDDKGENALKGLPLATRELTGQTINSSNMAVYVMVSDQNDPNYGKMIVKPNTKAPTNLNNKIPAKATNPQGTPTVGTIAVYEYGTDLDANSKSHSLSGVTISKYADLYLDQNWELPNGLKMPAHKILAKDAGGNEIGKVDVLESDNNTSRRRQIVVPDVKVWNIANDGNATRIVPKIDQGLPKTEKIGEKTYKYLENYNYYEPTKNEYFIHNRATEDITTKLASFKLVKVHKYTNEKGQEVIEKLPGARFRLFRGPEVETDSNGEAKFSNIPPGSYSIIETKAPDGYKLGEDIYFTVDREGRINKTGGPGTIVGGVTPTTTIEHKQWPSYMNAMHYGNLDSSGNITSYIFLKALGNKTGGTTDRNTLVKLNFTNISDSKVEVFDVNPSDRNDIRSKMNLQTVSSDGLNPVLNKANNHPITGREVNGVYSIRFPKERFGEATDWGFLIKVTGKANGTPSLEYDWVSEEQGQASLLENKINLSSSTSQETVITVSNEPFAKKPIEVIKVDAKKNPLGGATFVLKDSGNNIIKTVTSNSTEGNDKGKVNFGNYPEGTYTIEEQASPDNYIESQIVFDVTVDKAGQVTYTARNKNGIGVPIKGEDYWIENEAVTDTSNRAKIIHVDQSMTLREGQAGGLGTRTGVWEAYRYESYTYHAIIDLQETTPGKRFEIQFDPNLDFTQYVNEIPSIKEKGKVIAKPYFDYDTNLLTYVFTDESNGGEVKFNLEIQGIIPSKFYAKNSGSYNFYVNVAPGINKSEVSGTKEINFDVEADYSVYDTDFDRPAQSYYFRDVYKEGNDWYVKAIAYYNPTALTSGSRTLSFNWMSTNYTNSANIVNWPGAGVEPAFKLDEVKIYKVLPSWGYDPGGTKYKLTSAMYMPLSMGVVPENDPTTYSLVYSSKVEPSSSKKDSQSGIRLEYDPKQIKATDAKLNSSSPLKLFMPPISGQKEGYVIEQDFKVTDLNKFRDMFRAFYMSNGSLKSAFASKVNTNEAAAEQNNREIPKFYSQKVMMANQRYTPGNFTITKLDETNKKPIENVEFALTDSNNHTIYRSSNAEGIIPFTDLKPGVYTLKETKTPDSYITSDKTWQVNVAMDGTVTITEIGLNADDTTHVDKNLKIEITNKPSGKDFVVYKKGDTGQPLEGATFTIKKKDSADVYTKGTSDDKGVVKFDKKLENGTYILEETVAPTGYKILDKKWVLVVSDTGVKVHEYIKQSSTQSGEKIESLLREEGTHWVNIAKRPVGGRFTGLNDPRITGYLDNYPVPHKVGTRIVGINKTKNFVVQRFVINPEAASVGKSMVQIYREPLNSNNMRWYNGETFKVYKLDKAVTGRAGDIKLDNYDVTELSVSGKSVKKEGEIPNRLQLELPATDKPIVIDVKIPYDNENGAVGTGIDYWENYDPKATAHTVYWKPDYYEYVSDIVEGEPVPSKKEDSIIGGLISEGSLDVTNNRNKHEFEFKKVKEKTTDAVSGATFSLERIDKPEEKAKWEKSGQDGKVHFKDLLPGKYKLVEHGAAQGYELANTDWTVTVLEDGKVYIKDNNGSNTVTDNNPEHKWQKVKVNEGTKTNSANTEVPDHKDHPRRKLDTHIVEVNQTTHRMRQVYILNSSAENLNNPTLEIHSQPETRDITNANTKVVSINVVASNSTPDNLVNVRDSVPFKAQELYVNGHNRLKVDTNVIGAKTLAVTIESDMPEAGAIGTGMDFKNFTNTYWAAESYNSINDFSLESLSSQQVDKNTNLVVGNEKPIETNNGARSAVQNMLNMADAEGETFEQSAPIVTLALRSAYITRNAFRSVGDGWEKVDQNRSEGRTTSNRDADNQTKITEINKSQGKYRQIFLVNRSGSSVDSPRYRFHSEPLGTSIIGKTYYGRPINFKVLSIRPVLRSSTIDNIQYDGTGTIKYNRDEVIQDGQYHRFQFRLANNDRRPIAIEVEYDYPKSGEIGLGMDYYSDYRSNGVWAAEKYHSVDDINCKHFIQVDPPQNGTVIASKTYEKKGNKVTLDVRPNDSYVLDSLTVTDAKGRNVQVSDTSFVMPDTDVTVRATFRQNGGITYRYGYEDEKIPMTYTTVKDPNMDVGTQRVENGQDGIKRTYYKYEQRNGVDTGNKEKDTSQGNDGEEIIKEMKPQVTYIGAKEVKTYTVLTENTKLSAKPNQNVAQGTPVKVTVTPGPNEQLDRLYYNDGSRDVDIDKTTMTFNMPASNVTVKATYKQKTQPGGTEHNINIVQNSQINGTIQVPSSAKAGSTVNVSVTPKSGYYLKDLEVLDRSGGKAADYDKATNSFVMPATNVWLKPIFELQSGQFKVNILPTTNGTVTTDKTTANAGDSVKLKFQPAEGYELDKLTINNIEYKVNDNEFYFHMQKYDINVQATFKEKVKFYEIKTDQTEGGWVSVDKTKAKAGETVTVTVQVHNGYELGQVTANGTPVLLKDGKYTFKMPADTVNVSATFFKPDEAESYIVGIDRNDTRYHVNITEGVDGNSQAVAGKTVRFKATPQIGFVMTGAYVKTSNGVTIPVDFANNEGSFVMPKSNCTIYLRWDQDPPQAGVNTVFVDPGMVGGAVKLNNNDWNKPLAANKDARVNLTIYTRTGYTNTGYWVSTTNGGSVPVKHDSKGPFFIMPDEDVTVYATFARQAQGSYSVTVKPSDHGRVIARPTSANEGTTINLDARADNGYKLASYKVTAASGQVIDVKNNSFVMPAGNITIEASFIGENEAIPGDPGSGQALPDDNELGYLIYDPVNKKQKDLSITNKPAGLELNVFKKDPLGSPLQGGEFTLTRVDKNFENPVGNITLTGVSSNEGKIVFRDGKGNIAKLEKGYYVLKETKPPLGFKQATSDWRIEVKDDNGRMHAVYYGPKKTVDEFLKDDNLAKFEGTTTPGKGIKTASRITHIDPVAKTFVQRTIIDLREYKGKKINVQIAPKHKRDETDFVPQKDKIVPPNTNLEGLKTAYRTTYKITNPPSDIDIDRVLKYYDLSEKKVSMVNTARWRPFNWGFDEDQLNLEPGGLYFIDVEGYYDDALITGKATYEKDDEGNIKPAYDRTDITEEDLGKLQMDFKLYKGAREFQQAIYNEKTKDIEWKAFPKASYQAGAGEYAKTQESGWSGKRKNGAKYQNWLGKDGGRIFPALDEVNLYETISTGPKISDLYTSSKKTDEPLEIPKTGLDLVNEEESYNITFSKHGRDGEGKDWSNNSKKVTENRLEGAIFKLQKEFQNGFADLPGTYVSSAFNGYFGFRGLKPGRYRLMEVQAPPGYRPIDDAILYMTIAYEKPKTNTQGEITPGRGSITLEYNNSNGIIQYAGANTEGEGKLTDFVTSATAKNMGKIINEKPGKGRVTLVKKDENGKVLNGAEFRLTRLGVKTTENSEENNTIFTSKSKNIQVTAKTTVLEKAKQLDNKVETGVLVLDQLVAGTTEISGSTLANVNVKIKVADGEENPVKSDNRGYFSYTSPTPLVKDQVVSASIEEDGIAIFNQLPIGNYEMEEVTPAPGHKLTGQRWYFTVGGKDLDPYSGDIAKTGSDRSSNITLTTDLTIKRPDKDDKTKGNETIRPNSAQMLNFATTFKIDAKTVINPGDYFTVKLTKNIDLKGIFKKKKPEGLDLFADGVGTIAKAEYNETDNEITYTFTDYARTYKLLEFNANYIAHINPDVVTKDEKVKVGPWMNNDETSTKYIKVEYDRGTKESGIDKTVYPNEQLSMSSKITYFDPQTGEFTHIFYINPNKMNSGGAIFDYYPGKNITNVRVQMYDVGNANIDTSMPASYSLKGVRGNLVLNDSYYGRNVNDYNRAWIRFSSGSRLSLNANDGYLVKVTGNIADGEDKTSYTPRAYLINYYNNGNPRLWAYREDAVYSNTSDATAKADLTINAVNPKNEIIFRKTDQNKEALEGAEFKLLVKTTDNAEGWKDAVGVDGKTPLTAKSGPDGIFKFDTLPEGIYALVETKAPEGYTTIDRHIEEFIVTKTGIIKIKSDNKVETESSTIEKNVNKLKSLFENKVAAGGNTADTNPVQTADDSGEYKPIGSDPIIVINYKDIDFIKVDSVDGTRLKGAEFELWYKEKDTDVYKAIDTTIYKNLIKYGKDSSGNLDGSFTVHVTKEGYYALVETKAPEGYTKMPGYIREFRIGNGKVQVLEKDPLRASRRLSGRGMLESEILKVDEENNFTQRIIINPDHKSWTFDGASTIFSLDEVDWKTLERSNQDGPKIKVAVLDKGKKIEDLEYQEISSSSGDGTTKNFQINQILKTGDYTTDPNNTNKLTTEKSIVLEFVGKTTGTEDKAGKANLKYQLRENLSILGTISYDFDINNFKNIGKGIYVDKPNLRPVEVENKKSTYPLTGGMGTFIFTCVGASLIGLAYLSYRRRRGLVFDE